MNMNSITKILVIEDDPFQQQVISKILSRLTSAKIILTDNGIAALNQLDNGLVPELILCDLNMPHMDGVELLRCLSERQLQCPITLISAADEDVVTSVIKMAHSYGLNRVTNICKPVTAKQLTETLKLQMLAPMSSPKEKLAYQPTESELYQGLQNGEFIAYFQPHLSAKTDRITGAEALVRWQHPIHGLLSPYYFLDTLMKVGLSSILTEVITKQAVFACKSWHQAGFNLNISVNVAQSDLDKQDFTDNLLRLLNKCKLPNKYLTLEITETELSSNIGTLLNTVSRLRLNGIKISIDDFGTGHSSLKQLIDTPFSELKIDQSFTKNMLTSHKHMAAVKFSLMLAKQLELKSVAEGVESIEQKQKLKELGCDILQGYLISKPVAETDFSHLLERTRDRIPA
ncbi:EAL domain-containing protein [Shewanella sp. UCD-KL12]|uniref:EAL domain-containing response regulator n=1 Tax=Shewanella sp. UCD-KL12 TaxID=1917163 RepID=UPI00097087C0|nr:EAL domain-containing response regulator [Shewanella sp. UCD-KL12]